VVHFYNEGYSPEMLLGQFPTLPLPLIYHTIAFYLENQSEVDSYIARSDEAIAQQREAARKGPDLAELRRRMEAMSQAHDDPGCGRLYGAGGLRL
jgi:hypothetical protein